MCILNESEVYKKTKYMNIFSRIKIFVKKSFDFDANS